MGRDPEVRIFLMDTECELRPLSAAQALEARRESRRLLTEYGGDERDRALIESACLVAAGLYADGRPVFPDGLEALLSLTEEEIAFAAAGYSETQERAAARPFSGAAREESGESSPTGIPAPEEAERVTETRAPSPAAEEAVGRLRRVQSDDPTQGDAARSAEKTAAWRKEEALRKFGMLWMPFGERAEKPREPSAPTPAADIPEADGTPLPETGTRRSGRYRSRMEELSDFFERDSRRYDGRLSDE